MAHVYCCGKKSCGMKCKEPVGFLQLSTDGAARHLCGGGFVVVVELLLCGVPFLFFCCLLSLLAYWRFDWDSTVYNKDYGTSSKIELPF